MSTSQAIQAQQMHEPRLLAKANVVGVAVGFKEAKGSTSGEVAVIVLVEQKKPLAALSAEDVIPPELEGMKTDVYEVGYLRAQQLPPTQQDPKSRFRPIIPPGVSIGHYKVTAGTFGAFVTDRSTGEKFILSNNHVLANSNDALIGDPILQPGAIDGGQNPGDVVATLERFIKLAYTDDPVVAPPQNPPTSPIPTPPAQPPTTGTTPSGCDIVDVVVSLANAAATLFGSQKRVQSTTLGTQSAGSPTLVAPVPTAQADVPTNTVDCALAKPINPAMFTDQILQIGQVSGTKAATLGQRVRKFGRTTSYTEGNVTLLNATVNISYSTIAGAKTARFTGMVVTESMSDGGDSGSLIVDVTENKAVGLLFAGSSLATIFIPIDTVLAQLNVSI